MLDVQGGGAQRFAVLAGLFALELHPERMLTRRQGPRDEVLFGFDTQEVVDVVQVAVLDEQGMPTEARAVRKNDAFGRLG